VVATEAVGAEGFNARPWRVLIVMVCAAVSVVDAEVAVEAEMEG